MKKILLSLALLVAISAGAAIKPQSIGVYKEYAPMGEFDPYCRLRYNEDNTFFAFVLKHYEKYDPNVFILELGTSMDEAAASILALNRILTTGQKGEMFVLDEQTTIRKVDKYNMHVYRVGEIDCGLLSKPYLTKSLDFLRQRATNNK